MLVPDVSEAAEKSIAISPDNRHVAFFAKDSTRVVVDGLSQGPYDRVYGLLCFSPDSQRVVYLVVVGDRQVALVVDRVSREAVYDRIGENGPVFSLTASTSRTRRRRRASGWW